MADPIDDSKRTDESGKQSSSHTGAFVALGIGLALSLAANGYLINRSSQTDDRIAELRDSTHAQMTKLGDATSSLLEQRLQSLNDQVNAAAEASKTSMSAAIRQTRTLAQKQADEIRGNLQDQQQQVAGELTQLKDATSSVDSKVSEVATDVSGVKTDVNGVKADVTTTQQNLEKTASDLKRATGDMGVMSGLIATNGKELEALRALGERNYMEFDLRKGQVEKKLGNVTVVMKKSDPKHNRYTVELVADDKRVEKRDKTTNDPVQFYVSNSRQPDEIVVNQVKKDEITGYLSTPKVTMARQ
jgi:chromosome segregation ATPase